MSTYNPNTAWNTIVAYVLHIRMLCLQGCEDETDDGALFGNPPK